LRSIFFSAAQCCQFVPPTLSRKRVEIFAFCIQICVEGAEANLPLASLRLPHSSCVFRVKAPLINHVDLKRLFVFSFPSSWLSAEMISFPPRRLIIRVSRNKKNKKQQKAASAAGEGVFMRNGLNTLVHTIKDPSLRRVR
jgi:hypothetical protein